MNLYAVSSKYGRSPYQLSAYVEADSPKQAIKRYSGDSYDANIADGMLYRASKSKLPSYYWEMAGYCRPPYITEDGTEK